jgi:hypothetical protein
MHACIHACMRSQQATQARVDAPPPAVRHRKRTVKLAMLALMMRTTRAKRLASTMTAPRAAGRATGRTADVARRRAPALLRGATRTGAGPATARG